MCGITGFAGENRGTIEKMTAALVHRGPDGNAVYVGNGISLGHARLAILDPRPEGNQPMWNDEKTVVIVYNGEIFNFKELREREGFKCRTNTDTEVLIKLYEKYGVKFVDRLRGMFAFGIYDTRNQTWFLARDASGIKPLYLAEIGGQLHFASETRALSMAMPAKPMINEEALSLYMRLQYIPGPLTLYKGIESVRPGAVITWRAGIRKEQIVEPKLDVTRLPHYENRNEFMREFPALMQEATTAHLIADRPVGLFLSGGMDSSILLHHMSQATTSPARTFTVRFAMPGEPGEQRFNMDADLAVQTAKHYGTQHQEVELTATAYRDAYRDTARALDQANANPTAVAWYVLAKAAKQSVDVVLTGAGGDELFGGSHRYRAAHILNTMRWLPPSLRSLIGRSSGYSADVFALSPHDVAFAERFMAQPSTEVLSIARGNWFDGNAVRKLLAPYFETSQKDPVRKFMECERHTWLVDEALRLADATTMASGLECRVPFLDPFVIAASHATPASWHVNFFDTKVLLKKTYRPLLPPHVFSLKKSSFFPPLAKWLRTECAVLGEEMVESPFLAQYFDVDAIRAVLKKHQTGEEYALQLISRLIQLHFWIETVYNAKL